jgi:hypothetical protein
MAGEEAPMIPAIPVRRSKFALSLAGCALSVASLGAISSCKTVDLSGAEQDTTHVQAADSVSLRITNKLGIDPDSLVFYLYPPTAEVTNSLNGRKVGGVAYGKTASFKLPVGTWKMAYENGAKVMHFMQSTQSDEWIKSILEKGGDYSLIIQDDGNIIYWEVSFKTDPAI